MTTEPLGQPAMVARLLRLRASLDDRSRLDDAGDRSRGDVGGDVGGPDEGS